MEQRHQEQLTLLENKRREIEELEEQFQERESSRLKEQEAVEAQLEVRKQHLETMLEEAETLKKEAEEVKREAEIESARWKRSQDVEQQLNEWRKERADSIGSDVCALTYCQSILIHCNTVFR
jgi:hypothetical protein